MARIERIHITGASGSGTTTLGSALAQRIGLEHFDADDFFWKPSDPPYERKRDPAERSRLLAETIRPSHRWIFSGSMLRWAVPRSEWFDLVVFLCIPPALRMERLAAREVERYGADRIAPGGDMHRIHSEFMAWAERYDTAGEDQRSRVGHERWLATLPCPVLRIEGDVAVAERVERIAARVSGSVRR